MSVFFALGSYLLNSSPPSVMNGQTFPLTIGGWIGPSQISPNTAYTWFSLGSNVVRNTWSLGVQDSAGVKTFYLYCDNGTTFETTTLGSPAPSSPGNQAGWAYVVARFISVSNRRFSAFSGTVGGIGHAQGTTSITISSAFTRVRLGERADNTSQPWLGQLAEYWSAAMDIFPGGGQLPNEMLVKLALDGPLSFPMIAPNLIEYRSFKKPSALAGHTGVGTGSNVDIIGEEYWAGYGGRPTWTSVIGANPSAIAPANTYHSPYVGSTTLRKIGRLNAEPSFLKFTTRSAATTTAFMVPSHAVNVRRIVRSIGY